MSIEHFTITCDGWSSKMGDRFLAIACHGMDIDFNRISRVLGVIPVSEDHTIINLSQRIKEVLELYSILNRTWLGVTDNAANESGAIREPC